jgi:hypothetical protein
MVKKIITFSFLFWVGFFFLGCSNNSINQIDSLTENQKNEIKKKIIRYIGHKPEDASHQNKFHSYFDKHYAKEEKNHDLEFYYKKSDGRIYFLFTRIAPSVKLKKVGIAGYCVLDEKGEITEFEEVFRTWKQEPKELQAINELLFQKMVQQEDLKPYYIENSGGKEYIEFPNKEVWYDKKIRQWISSRVDPLQEFYEEKIQRTQLKLNELDQSKD